ncbi:MAG TPA: DoxX family protein, partial [Citricoccus sp.]
VEPGGRTPAAPVQARDVVTDGASSATPAAPTAGSTGSAGYSGSAGSSAAPSVSSAPSPTEPTVEGAGDAPPARRRRARPARPDATLLPLPQAARDVVLFLARLVVGVVLIAHGLQKLVQGAPGTAEGFAQMGVPQPEVAAIIAMVAELGGGVLLILGLMTPLAALLPAVVLIGAVVVHAGNGLFVTEGGWELAATLGAACLVLGAVGPGRWSVDGLLTRLRRDH